MTLNFDYILSSSLSLVLHGAVGFGLYGAITSGPQIDFHSGNNGIGISIISPSELRSSSSTSEGTVAPQSAQAEASLPQTNAEISIKRILARATISRPPKLIPVRAVVPAPQSAQPSVAPTQSEANQPCSSGSDCGTRSSLGRSGDAGVSTIGVIQAPKPPYPWAARRAGFEGQVVVAVDVTKEGSVRAAALAKSSGREDCDQSAVETIRERWRFEPARINGTPIDWHEEIVVVYNLKN